MCLKHSLKTIFAPYQDEQNIAVGVSGGSDSLALLLLLNEWKSALTAHSTQDAPNIYAFTVDHGLRREALSEATYVGEICAKYGISHQILTWQHSGGQKPQAKLAEKAREARYQLMAEAAQQLDCRHILLAHTEDDQAETVMMRALHRGKHNSKINANSGKFAKMGTGFRGLAAMSSSVTHETGICYARPLLKFSRQNLRDYLTSKNIKWVDDPSNQNYAYERPRIRAFLQSSDNTISIPSLSRFANCMSRWRGDAAKRAADLIETHASAYQNSKGISQLGVVELDDNFFNAAPLTIQLLTIRALIAAIGGQNYLPPIDASQNLLAALTKENFKGLTLGGCRIKPTATQFGTLKLRLWRETRNIKPKMINPNPSNNIWDGRFSWKYKGAENSPAIELRALGTAGIDQLKSWEHISVHEQSRHSITSLPALWSGDKLLHVPFINASLDEGGATNWREQFEISPFIPAFQRFENPLDQPLREQLIALIASTYTKQ